MKKKDLNTSLVRIVYLKTTQCKDRVSRIDSKVSEYIIWSPVVIRAKHCGSELTTGFEAVLIVLPNA